jgi:multicomponent Na+:H+ antiporter subunit F
MLALAFVLAFVRLLRGPSLPDRVVALDLMASLAVGIMAVTAIGLDAPSLLQPALVLAFVAFLGTVAFARYVEKTGSQQEDK